MEKGEDTMKADLELYRVFAAVAEAGSVSRGAQMLFLTQPAASQAVKKLETRLGAQLLVRGRRGVTLTQEGELVYRHAKAALELLETAENKLERTQELEEGTLKLGAADTITKEFLLPYLADFRAAHPGVQLSVVNRTSPQIAERLAKGELDIAVVNLPLPDDRLEVRPVLQVHDVFIAGETFADLRDRTLPLRELSRYPLVMLERSANSRRAVDAFLAREGVELAPAVELGAHSLLADFAEIGFGLACVVREFCAQPLESGKVFPVRLAPPLPPRYIGACWAKDVPLTACASEFLSRLQSGAHSGSRQSPASWT